jgi:catalase
MLGGFDPDFHRRDLYDAIEAGAFPQWELGLQVFEDNAEQTFEGIDLLDPTKLVPEELAPVQPVGVLTLTANPTNFFAEVEQVAFHLGHLVPGIDVTDDPLLQARLFSYLDTQLTRLGGPNFTQIPINRPHAPVNDMLRDGFHQHAVHGGAAPYRPNSLDGGCPFHAGAGEGAFVEAPVVVASGSKERSAPASYDDHFSQARLFWLSMSAVEQDHIVRAYVFELNKCYEKAIKERQVRALAAIDPELCSRVAEGLGLPAPEASETLADVEPSPALSQVGEEWPIDGRLVGVVVDDGTDPSLVSEVKSAIRAADALPLVVAPHGGELPDGSPIQRSLDATRSVEFDAVVLAGSQADDNLDPRLLLLVQEAYRHAKPIAVVGDASEDVLSAAGALPDAPGVVRGGGTAETVESLLAEMRKHRAWDRLAG